MKYFFTIFFFVFAISAYAKPSYWKGYVEYVYVEKDKEYITIDHTPRIDWWNEVVVRKYDARKNKYWSNTTIGSGSGSFSKTSMGALTQGDTLFITDGTYNSASTITNLTGIVILPLNWATSGRVIMGNTLNFGSNTACKLKFMSGNGIAGVFIDWSGHSQDDTLQNVSGNNVTGNFMDGNTSLAYNGTTASFVTYRNVYDSLTVVSCGYLFFGSFGQAQAVNNYNDSITFSRILIDQTRTNGEEWRGPGFRIYSHDWLVTYTGTNPSGGDVGIFTLFGNMVMWNIYAYGTQGYLFRNYTSRLVGSSSFSMIYNSVKAQGTRYGLASFRVSTDNIVPGTTEGCDQYQYNTTVINCIDDGEYITSAQVWGASAGFTLHLKNNLAINNASDATTTHIIHNDSGGAGTLDSITNKWYIDNNTPVVILDVTGGFPTYKPVSAASPVVGTGTNVGLTVDYYGQLLGSTFNKGFAAFSGAPPPPTPGNQIQIHKGILQYRIVMTKPKELKFKTKIYASIYG